MTASNGNRAASATWLTGSTFTALAIPLALFGAQPLDVSLGGLTLRGKFDDYAMQYLGVAAAVGLGLGASRLMASDGSTSQPSKGSDLTSLPALSNPSGSVLTEASLKASGLQAFLDEDDAPLVIRPAAEVTSFYPPQAAEVQTSQNLDANNSQHVAPEAVQSAVPQAVQPSTQYSPQADSGATADTLASIVAEVQTIVQQMSLQSPGVAAAQASVARNADDAVVANNYGVVAANAEVRVGTVPLVSHSHRSPILPSAQSYVSFARPQATVAQSSPRDLQAEMAVLEQVYQIREQMQSLMNQVDLIQAGLEQTVYPAQRLVPLRAAQAPSYTVSAVEPFRAANNHLPYGGQMAS